MVVHYCSECPELSLGIHPIHRIGKEANLLDDRVSGMAADADEYLNEYVDPNADRDSLVRVEISGNAFMRRLGEGTAGGRTGRIRLRRAGHRRSVPQRWPVPYDSSNWPRPSRGGGSNPSRTHIVHDQLVSGVLSAVPVVWSWRRRDAHDVRHVDVECRERAEVAR